MLKKKSLSSEYLLLFFLGGISSFSQAPTFFIPAFIISISFLCYFFIKSKNFKHTFLIGFFYGFGKMLFDIYWIGFAFIIGETGGWLAGVIAVVFLSIFLALFFAFATVFAFILKPNNTFFRTIALLVSLSFFEWLKGNSFTGFPWNPSSAIWTLSHYTMQPLAFIGTWAYSLVTILAAGAPVLIRNSLKGAVSLVSPLLIVLILSAIFYKENSPEEKYLVRIVQPNILQNSKWEKNELFKNFQKHLEMSQILSSDKQNANLIIWSETASPYDLSHDESARRMISKVLHNGSYLITGFVRYETLDRKDPSFYNSIGVISSDGKLIEYYDKSHLVPFGEYIPFKKYIPFSKITNGIDNFTSGKGLQTISLLNQFKFSPLICYEIIFPGKAVDNKLRPDVLINVTNDAWYGRTAGPHQHFALAKMRAVEEGLPLIRAANTGISAIVDSKGKVLRKIGFMEEGVIQAYIPSKETKTIYSKINDLVFWMGTIGILLLILYRRYC